ncbi:hypothetical protein Vadar_030947 [Vaccinium darrowii]|uniref:Uncharacterized protein n=1 Tax=Vaccinium darrowii TaxID=229202 RepID=A0ACB7ZP08_9ERIC|nr:hypothetical protein Vadar_030947 [Vaccinium darrowii]
MAQLQISEDGNSEDEETRVSIRKKELEVFVIRIMDRRIHQVIEQNIGPMIYRIVKQEFELAAEKLSTRLNCHSGIGVQSSESRTLQLLFMGKLSLPVMTNLPIKGEGTTPFRVALVDATTKQVVTSGLEASAKVEIVVVEGDFDGDNWTLDEFNNKIVRGKERRKSLLTGNVCLNLEEGVGLVRDISFTHNSHWMKNCELRLGAKVVGNLNGTRVREAVTEPFLLEDYRKTYTEKHYPPSPNDEVWRLTNIAKDGPFHSRLVSENIKTVKDFLTRCCINPKSLQNILGAGKIWKSTVAHAQTCKIMRLYFPIGSGKKSGVVFNAAGQVMGLISECCYVPLDELSEDQKADANKLVVSALEHMGDVMTFNDETSLHSHLQLLNDACPSYSPMLERPSHYNCEPLHTHYGHDHTQPSSSSHNHQVVPFHLPEAANPSTIPSAVKDHLTRFFLDPQSLQNILGTAQMREAIVDHARTCILDKSLHLYFPTGSEKKYGVVFNVLGQVMGLISNCCYVPLDNLSEDQKGVANNLVVSALEHMEEVMSFSDETHLHSQLQLQLHDDAYPPNSTRLESLSHYNCEPSDADYGHDHTQTSTSSLINQLVPFTLSDAADPPNTPSTDSLVIMPFASSFGNASLLNELDLPSIAAVDLINEDYSTFPGNFFNPSICYTESTCQTFPESRHLQLVDNDHSSQYQYSSSEAQDLGSIVNAFLSSRAAAHIAQRRWSRLSYVLRIIRKSAASKLVSSEAVLASKRQRIC